MILGGDPISKSLYELFGSLVGMIPCTEQLSVSTYVRLLCRDGESDELGRDLVSLCCGCTTEHLGPDPYACGLYCCRLVYQEIDGLGSDKLDYRTCEERTSSRDHHKQETKRSDGLVRILNVYQIFRTRRRLCLPTKANIRGGRRDQPSPNNDPLETAQRLDFYQTKEVYSHA